MRRCATYAYGVEGARGDELKMSWGCIAAMERPICPTFGLLRPGTARHIERLLPKPSQHCHSDQELFWEDYVNV